MTMRHIFTHPLFIAAALLVSPFLLITYYYCAWLLVG